MIVLSVSTLILSWENISRIWINQNNEWSKDVALQIVDLQNEKRAAEYVITQPPYYYVLKYWDFCLLQRVLNTTLYALYRPVSHLLRTFSIPPIRAMRPSCGWECYLLRIALRVAVVTRYRLVKIRLIKFCKVQGKKRLTSNCLAAYLIWANTSYNTIDGLSFYLKRFPYICDFKKNFVQHFFKFCTPFVHHFCVKLREDITWYVNVNPLNSIYNG